MTDLSLAVSDIEEVRVANKAKEKKLLGMLKTYKDKYKQFEQLKTYIKREVEKLKGASAKEENYFRGENDAAEEDAQDYGREVLKGPYEERLKVPFRRFPLYRLSSSKYGIIGNPTDGVIKGDIKIADHSGQTVQQSTKKSSKKSAKSGKSVKSMAEEKVDHSFNLFDQGFLDFFNEPYRLKVRLYLLRCLNLAA